MWSIILCKTGEVLITGLTTLAEANKWHDDWLDTLTDEQKDNDDYRVDFKETGR